MKIRVNGKEESVDTGINLQTFLNDNQMKSDQVVVAVNDEVIEREEYSSTSINEGDVLDVMSFVGGG